MADILPSPSHACNLPPDQLALIGMTNHNWSLIDNFCRLILKALLQLHPDEGKQIISFSSMEGMADLLKKVANNRIDDPDVKSLALACVPELKRLAKDRAIMIHGLWAKSVDDGSAMAMMIKNPKVTVADSDISRIYAETANLSNAIAYVWWEIEIRASPSPWRDKWLQGNHPCPPYSPYPQEQ